MTGIKQTIKKNGGSVIYKTHTQNITLKQLPSLAENTILRYFNFMVLYVAQGIPEGMTFYGIPAWMAMHGKSAAEIGGFVSIIIIPWSFKFLIAPVMDRYSFLPMGRRRPWVLFGQLGLICSYIGMALVPDPLNNLPLFIFAGFCVSFFGALQDVATDGMAVDIVPVHQQARANGLMWGAKTIGIAVSLAIGTWLINHFGFRMAILAMSVAIGMIMLAPLLLRERPGEKLLPWSAGQTATETASLKIENWHEIFKSFLRVFTLRYSLVLALLLYLMGTAFNFMNTLIPIFTVQHLHWTNQQYSSVYSAASICGGLLGMLVGGFLIDHFGKLRMLRMYYLLLIGITVSMAYSAIYWRTGYVTQLYIFVYTALFVFSMVGIFAVSMQFCWKKISATQFTVYMAISNLGYATGSAAIGPLRAHFNWQNTILFFPIVVTLAFLVIQFIRIKFHVEQVEKLELPEQINPVIIV